MALLPAQNISSADDTSETGSQNYTPALMSLAVLYFMMGFITCLNDTLVPFFKKGFTLSYSESSLVQFYFFLTYGIMSIPAGKIVERIGYKKGMVTGFAIAAFGALLFYPAANLHEYVLFLAALFVVAIGIVILQVAANPYVTVLGPAKTASSRLTLIQGVGSIGTTVAPLFGAYFILSPLQASSTSSDAVKYPYLGIAALLLIIALIVSRLSLPTIQTGGATQEKDATPGSGIFSFRNLNLGIIAIFVYVGAEVSIGTFLTNYISDSLSISESDANTYVSFFWGSMLVGRLIGSVLLKSIRPQLLLTITSITAIVLILFSINSSGSIAVWSMIAVGLCNSVMFAIIFSLSVNGIGKYTTQASGYLSSAIVGGALISLAQGIVKDHSTWQIAFLIPVACYAYLLFYGVNGYKSRQSQSH
jgi:FHS family L-fucose permease-like MFS transporter